MFVIKQIPFSSTWVCSTHFCAGFRGFIGETVDVNYVTPVSQDLWTTILSVLILISLILQRNDVVLKPWLLSVYSNNIQQWVMAHSENEGRHFPIVELQWLFPIEFGYSIP